VTWIRRCPGCGAVKQLPSQQAVDLSSEVDEDTGVMLFHDPQGFISSLMRESAQDEEIGWYQDLDKRNRSLRYDKSKDQGETCPGMRGQKLV